MHALVAQIRPFSWKRWPVLVGSGSGLLFTEVAEFHPDQSSQAEFFWRWLAHSQEAADTLQSYCGAESPPERCWYNADWRRMLDNARFAFATGVAAGYLRHIGVQASASETAADACIRWLGLASGFPPGERLPLVNSFTGRAWAADPLPRLEQLLAALPETVEAAFPHYCKPALALWLHFWLTGRKGATGPFVRQCKAAMATIEGEIGHVHDLHFALLPGAVSPGQRLNLIDHPSDAFRPVTPGWRDVLGQQIQTLAWH